MTTIPIAGSLNNKSFESALRRALATNPTQSRDDAILLDLSACSFIEAPAATMLAALAYDLARGQRAVQFHPPTDTDARTYFRQCGLERTLSDGGVGAFASDLEAVGEYALPVCRVAGERDVAVIGEFIHRSVTQMLGGSATFASRSRSIFDALCENVVVHAEAGLGGWAAAQVHRRGDGRVFARIGVADVGVGIPTTMARQHPELGRHSSAEHCEAIFSATEPGMSGTLTGGGIGLAQVRQLTADCRGTLYIRSLTGQVTIGIYPTSRSHVTHFPGTQLHVILVGRS